MHENDVKTYNSNFSKSCKLIGVRIGPNAACQSLHVCMASISGWNAFPSQGYPPVFLSVCPNSLPLQIYTSDRERYCKSETEEGGYPQKN